MKIQTSIQPRRDGSVSVVGEDGQNYKFVADADGVLVCDIEHEPTVARMLSLGDFEPVDAADFERAIELTQQLEQQDDDAEDEDFEDEANEDAMPEEANTPPVAKRGKKARSAA